MNLTFPTLLVAALLLAPSVNQAEAATTSGASTQHRADLRYDYAMRNPHHTRAAPAVFTHRAESEAPNNVSLFDRGPDPMDRGGLLAYYVSDIRQDNAANRLRVIEGTCMSACTIYLGARKRCVRPDAVLWFHAPTRTIFNSHLTDFTKTVAYSAIPFMMQFYPPRVAAWAREVHALESVDFSPAHTLTGAQLIKMGIPRC